LTVRILRRKTDKQNFLPNSIKSLCRCSLAEAFFVAAVAA
jgi:hypothetical protein